MSYRAMKCYMVGYGMLYTLRDCGISFMSYQQCHAISDVLAVSILTALNETIPALPFVPANCATQKTNNTQIPCCTCNKAAK